MKLVFSLMLASIISIPFSQAQSVDDTEIVNRIVSAIENSEEFLDAEIMVVSVNGYVLLAGQATSDQQKQRASVAAAFAATNIRRLVNELEVVEAIDHSFDADDQAILDQIVEVIPDMSPSTLPVIHNGVVHLLGQVSREEGDEVANTISRMAGVKNIRISYEYIQ